MAEIKKEIPEHEKIIEDIYKKSDALNMYLSTLSLRLEDVVTNSKKKLVESKGMDYLNTHKGHLEYGKTGADLANQILLNEFKLDKTKFNEAELSAIVKTMYKVNEKTLTNFAKDNGADLHYGIFKDKYLEKHLQKLQTTTIFDHILKYDSMHHPAILDHIMAGKHSEYFKPNLIDDLKDNNLKIKMFEALQVWNKGGQKIGLDYLRKDDTWSLYLKNEHKK